MENKNYFFISGLPRSGSTLLSNLLKQNPNFYADISSPVSHLLQESIHIMNNSQSSVNIDNQRRESVLKSIVTGYYNQIDKNVIFDTSRDWTSKTSLLKSLYPYTKIICCVRDIVSILDSFERLYLKNPY